MSNGCGGQGGFEFVHLKNKLKRLPGVKAWKLDSLYEKIEFNCCIPHDHAFEKGGNIIDFWKANYKFCISLIEMLHWTNFTGRLSIFTFVFTSLNIFGIKYFNFK